MSYILFAILASLFTAFTTIIVKVSLKNTSSNLVTFIRSCFIVFLVLILLIFNKQLYNIKDIDTKSLIFLILSGVFTGLSWLSYFKAMKLGDCNKVVAIDKCSYLLTTLLFLIFYFDFTTKNANPLTIIMIVLSTGFIIFGTILMIPKSDINKNIKNSYIFYAILSLIFASLVSLFTKMGVRNVDTLLVLLIKTFVVVVVSLLFIVLKKEIVKIKSINKFEILIICISGCLTFLAWFLEIKALKNDFASPIVINGLIKSSVVFTFLLSSFILKEKFTKKSIFGVILITIGTLIVTIFSL